MTFFDLPDPNDIENHHPNPLYALYARLQESSDQVRDLFADLQDSHSVSQSHARLIACSLDQARDSATDLDIDRAVKMNRSILLTLKAFEGSELPNAQREHIHGLITDLFDLLSTYRIDVARRMGAEAVHVDIRKTQSSANQHASRVPLRVSLRVTQCMVRLLPRADRALYGELYQSELAELAQGKHARLTQIGYTLRALVRVWSLRRALAVEAVGEVDQA